MSLKVEQLDLLQEYNANVYSIQQNKFKAQFLCTEETDRLLFESTNDWSAPLFKTVEDEYIHWPSPHEHLRIWFKKRIQIEPKHKEEWRICMVDLSSGTMSLEMKERTCNSVQERNLFLSEYGVNIVDSDCDLAQKETLLTYKQIYTHKLDGSLRCCLSSTLFPDGELYHVGTVKASRQEAIEELLEQLNVEKGCHPFLEWMRRTDEVSFDLPLCTRRTEQNEENIPEEELLRVISSPQFQEASQFICQIFAPADNGSGSHQLMFPSPSAKY